MSLLTTFSIERTPPSGSTGLPCNPTVLRHMAHEMRQPLSTIEATAFYLGIILSESETRARGHVEKLQGLIQQINGILSDTLLLTDAIAPRVETVDFSETVSSCIAEQGGGISAEYTVRVQDVETSAGGGWLVSLDPALARRMVVSLLQFARNYAADEPWLSVQLSNTGLYVRLCLLFAAAKVVLENFDCLFDPMTPRMPGGGAIALACTRRVAEAQDGKLEARLEAGGRLCLYLDVPVVPAQ